MNHDYEKYQRATGELKKAIFEILNPIIIPLLDWLENKLEKIFQ
jgi:hypothetical protein